MNRPAHHFTAPAGQDAQEPVCEVSGEAAETCSHIEDAEPPDSCCCGLPNCAECQAELTPAAQLALAAINEYRCATCRDIGILADACWDGRLLLYCPRCTGHDMRESGCAECGPAPTLAELEAAWLPALLPDIGVAAYRILSSYDGAIGFVCGCSGLLVAVTPYWRNTPWGLDLSHPCAEHRRFHLPACAVCGGHITWGLDVHLCCERRAS